MRRPFLPVIAAAVVLCACAAGSDETDGSGGGGQGGLGWSNSSSGSGGSGGAGDNGGGGGTAGNGGAATGPGGGGNGGDGGSAGNGGNGGNGGGGPASEQLIMFAAGSNDGLAGSYSPGSGWTTASVTGASNGAHIGVASATDALAVTRLSTTNALQFSVYNAGSWSALSAVGPNVTAQGLTLSRNGMAGSQHVIFHGQDFMHYHAIYANSLWNPVAQPVQPPASSQSFGPSTAAVAHAAGVTNILFAGNDGTLYAQAYSGSSWQAAQAIANSHSQLTPSLIAPSAAAELFAVWVNNQPSQLDDKKLFWSARSGATWSAPAKISDAVFTDDPVHAAALGNGGVLVAYRGTDGKAYTVRYTPGGNPLWSAAIPLAATNPNVVSAPAICRGADGADAELLYVATGAGTLHHSRLVANSWTAPASVGGSNLNSVDVGRVP